MAKTPNNIPHGYKATALGIIPQEWEIKTLNKACYFLDSQRIPIKDSDRAKISGIYPYYGASGIIDYVNSYIFDDDLILLAEDGANIINRSTPIAFLVNGKIWVNNHAHVLKAKPSFDRYYLCVYLESLKYNKYNTGTAQPKLNREVCEKIPILTPPLAEQKKIAEVLGVWDKAIEKQSQLIEQLTLRKRGLMQQLLTAKRRLPGFSGLWKKVRLGDIGDTYNGLSGKNKDDFEHGNAQFIPYINVFSNERIDITKLGCVQIEPNEQQNTVKYGDIFFTVSSETPDEVGMASVLLEHLDNTYLNSFCFGYRLNDFSTLNLFFAAYLFRTEHFRNYMFVLAQGSTRFNISKKEVMKHKIGLPTIEEQTAIAQVLTTADREIELTQQKLELLRQQKRGLMQQLLTGKKRIKI